MTIILVDHPTLLPAVDAMLAGEIAARKGAPLAPLVSGGGGLGRFDCVQHVLSHGELAPNGLLWAERASGLAVGAPVDRGAVAALADETVVVPLNPLLPMHREAKTRIEAACERAGRRLVRLAVEEEGETFVLRDDEGGALVFRRDAFGRPVEVGAAFETGDGPRILVVGEEAFHREVYPACLAALGDAADDLGLSMAFAFVDPRGVAEEAWAAILQGFDGLVLPGGSDMEQVAGQIGAARAAIVADLPTLGLCLGLQTMCTAVAQGVAGLSGAGLAEATPDAPIKTFVRLTDRAGRPAFRVGRRPMRVVAGTRLSALFGNAFADERYNHRFVLEPILVEPLETAGLKISGWQEDHDFADAVELPGHRFFMAMQGHPELSSRRDAPHPLIRDFVAAASGTVR